MGKETQNLNPASFASTPAAGRRISYGQPGAPLGRAGAAGTQPGAPSCQHAARQPRVSQPLPLTPSPTFWGRLFGCSRPTESPLLRRAAAGLPAGLGMEIQEMTSLPLEGGGDRGGEV